MESELPRIVQKASESHFSWTKFKCKTVLKMLKFCAFVKISYFMNNLFYVKTNIYIPIKITEMVKLISIVRT